MACKEQRIDPPCCGDPSRTAKPLQDKDSVNMLATNTRFPTQLFHEFLRTYNVVLLNSHCRKIFVVKIFSYDLLAYENIFTRKIIP